MKETDLAAQLICHIEGGGLYEAPLLGGCEWEIGKELDVKRVPVDIVLKGTVNKECIHHAIETKVRLSFELLDQAIKRTKYFDYTWICIPLRYKKDWKGVWQIPDSLECVLRHYGIGLIQVMSKADKVHACLLPKKNLKAQVQHIHMYEGHKQNVAGSIGSERFTFWTQVIVELDRIVKENPEGLRPADLIAMLPTAEMRRRVKIPRLTQWYRRGWGPLKKYNSTSTLETRKNRLYFVPCEF